MDRVMYHGTVRSLPLEEQFRAARLAGCTSLTTGPHEYCRLLSQGVPTADMRKMAADAGVRFEHLDPFVRWVPRWAPDNSCGPVPLQFLNYDEDDFFRMVDALEAKSVSVVGSFPPGAHTLNELIDCFGAFCTRAARHDLRCDLEFVAMWGIPDLATAWKIVSAVNAPNSGILLDFWHYTRSGSQDALLRTIPGRWITGVQLDDGDAVIPQGVTVLEDTINRRVPPGEGEFRVREIVSILRETGGLNRPGPEIFSAVFDTLSAEAIAEKCRKAVDWALAA